MNEQKNKQSLKSTCLGGWNFHKRAYTLQKNCNVPLRRKWRLPGILAAINRVVGGYSWRFPNGNSQVFQGDAWGSCQRSFWRCGKLLPEEFLGVSHRKEKKGNFQNFAPHKIRWMTVRAFASLRSGDAPGTRFYSKKSLCALESCSWFGCGRVITSSSNQLLRKSTLCPWPSS